MPAKQIKYTTSELFLVCFLLIVIFSQKSFAFNYFEKNSSVFSSSSNMLYNSSFEITSNPDIPDGWARDYEFPPWGADVFTVDDSNFYHGTKSVRIGHEGKFLCSWRRHTKIAKGEQYTFSVYLKADRENVQVSLDLSNVVSQKAYAGTKWTRFSITGEGKGNDTFCSIHLKSKGVLWIDAAQLEKNISPTDYIPSALDFQDYDAVRNSQYQDLYVFANSQTNCPKEKLKDKENSIFNLIGTEYDFYTTENNVHARCFINKTKPSSLLLWNLEKNGNAITQPKKIDIKSGKNEWFFSIGVLDYGDYILKVQYKVDESLIIRKQSEFRKLPPKKHEVKINRWGRFLVVDGSPMFFYGFYDNLSKGTKTRWISALNEMKNNNISGIISYVGGTKQYDMLGWALDESHKRGQKVWVHLGWLLSYSLPKYKNRADRFKNEEQAMAKLRDVVLKHKQHPALLGWATLDEPDNRPKIFTKEIVKKYYNLVKELDPYHPCIISHLSILGQSGCYGAATDIAVLPYSDHPYYDDLFQEYWDLGLPVFTNSTCIGGIGRWRREPTPAEQKERLYTAALKGARGLCTYTFRCNSMNTWKEIGVVGEQLKILSPVLLGSSDSIYLKNSLVRNSNVLILLKSYNDRFYMIAVNTGKNKEQVLLSLNSIVPDIENIEVMFDAHPAIYDHLKNNINFVMDGQSIAVYKF